MKCSNLAGTICFLAPEILAGNEISTLDLKKADIWSLGITMYCFAYLKIPFEGDSRKDILN
jgi:serine/threonine protein kinase